MRDKSNVPEIDVCVVTYRRPELLYKLLQSLDTQVTLKLFSYRVIVVDNDHLKTAKAVVRGIKPKKYSICYSVEPKKNISLARNKSLGLCTGEYVAIIDDDEGADKHWLLNLYQAALKYQADIVFGRVETIFPPNTSEYIRKSLIFDVAQPSSGANVGMEFYNSGNSFFKRSVIERASMRFDPQFGNTGGEDTRFFEELKQKGCSAVWCNEAVIYHYYPPSRVSLRWILQRAFRIGNNNIRLQGDDHWLASKSSYRIIQLGLAVKNILKLAIRFGSSILNDKFDCNYKIQLVNQLLVLLFYLGEMLSLFEYRYREYR